MCLNRRLISFSFGVNGVGVLKATFRETFSFLFFSFLCLLLFSSSSLTTLDLSLLPPLFTHFLTQ